MLAWVKTWRKWKKRDYQEKVLKQRWNGTESLERVWRITLQMVMKAGLKKDAVFMATQCFQRCSGVPSFCTSPSVG